MKKEYIFVVIGIIAIIIGFYLVNFKPNKKTIEKVQQQEYVNKQLDIYVIYSPTCPHCHNLLKTLESMNISVYKINVYDLNQYNIPEEVLNKFKKFGSGVPFVFARINNTYYYIIGYPAEFQEKDGYYYGKDLELKYCKTKGKPYFFNNTYLFCKLEDNVLLGNKYSLEWLINQCKKYCNS